METPLPRLLRDIKAHVQFPLWLLRNMPAPDNHVYKTKRILRLAHKYDCETFIETGTFYGQTVNVARKHFRKTYSIELFEPLYEFNKKAFAGDPGVEIFQGNSAQMLEKVIKKSSGRILYWLDGHYSGSGTGCGDITSPILEELAIIKKLGRSNDCILIDDARLFNGTDGYPTIEQTKEAILAIQPDYDVKIENDCIIAAPQLAT